MTALMGAINLQFGQTLISYKDVISCLSTFARILIAKPVFTFAEYALDRDDFSSNRHPALAFCFSMIFSENRFPLFRIMLYTGAGHSIIDRVLVAAS